MVLNIVSVYGEKQNLMCNVEASNVINVPKCNKGPKCNNFWP